MTYLELSQKQLSRECKWYQKWHFSIQTTYEEESQKTTFDIVGEMGEKMLGIRESVLTWSGGRVCIATCVIGVVCQRNTAV